MSIEIRNLMSTRIVTVEYDDRLSEVKKIFDSLRFHHLIVVDDGRVHGVLSDRDLLRALSPFIGTISETERDLHTLDKRVHQIMSRHLVTVGPATRLNEAIDLMLANSVSCLPVVDDHGGPLGIVTWRDILRALRPT